MRLIIGWVLLGCLSAVQAGELAEWVDRVASEQPQALQSQASQALAQAQKQQAQRWFPQGAEWRISHENDAMTGSEGIQNWELGIGFSLWAWGQREAQQGLADSYQQAQQDYQTLLKLDIAGVLRQAGWTLRETQVEVEMAEREWQVWLQLQQAVEQAVKSGDRPPLDAQLAKQAALQAQQTLIKAQFSQRQAQQQLAVWGINQPLADLAETLSSADWQQHPALRWQQQLVNQAQAEQQIARSQLSGQPSLSVAAKQEQTNQMAANTGLVVELTLPFGQGNQLALAKANHAQAEQQVSLAKLRRQLHQAWLQAQMQYELSQQQQTLLSQQIELNQSALIMAQRAYQAGETNLSELLRVQQQTLANQREAALAQVAVAKNLALLNQALGVLPQ